MEQCLETIRGTHDFSSFCSPGDGKVDPVRNMIQARLEALKGNILSFHFEANGFLRYMVRNIMGAIVRVGLGEIGIAQFSETVETKDRRHLGAKAPPGGLYLKDVKY